MGATIQETPPNSQQTTALITLYRGALICSVGDQFGLSRNCLFRAAKMGARAKMVLTFPVVLAVCTPENQRKPSARGGIHARRLARSRKKMASAGPTLGNYIPCHVSNPSESIQSHIWIWFVLTPSCGWLGTIFDKPELIMNGATWVPVVHSLFATPLIMSSRFSGASGDKKSGIVLGVLRGRRRN